MQLVLPLGIDPAENIVYANPCKQVSAVEFAQSVGVKRLVFDNSAELEKLAKAYPSAELLLRVQTDDASAQCPLSNKFGAAPADCAKLLSRAEALGLKVVGVSFHVGSGCSQPGAFRGAMHRAKAVFEEAERLGLQMTLLDIGGGFPGWDEEGQATFADHAKDICELLEELFPSPAIRVIAEPGRFFVATAQSLLTTVVSIAEGSSGDRIYLNDGLYGSFNCLLYDHATVPEAIVLRDGHELLGDDIQHGLCCIFGPTCDGFDVVAESMNLPRLQAQDKLLFPNMGAYTSAASTSFNGFSPAACFAYRSQVGDGQ
jgi:ornithine decarboxylase